MLEGNEIDGHFCVLGSSDRFISVCASSDACASRMLPSYTRIFNGVSRRSPLLSRRCASVWLKTDDWVNHILNRTGLYNHGGFTDQRMILDLKEKNPQEHFLMVFDDRFDGLPPDTGGKSSADFALAERASFSSRSGDIPELWADDLVYIPERGFASSPWQPVRDRKSGQVYYWNTDTNATTPLGAPKPESSLRCVRVGDMRAGAVDPSVLRAEAVPLDRVQRQLMYL